ncbi:glutathione S-transferase family protein [Algimonas porphyrae]|uniref:Glutathione S-transferase n=1 Tax=Algimonas porphyrae TaxID=1128113 RepID=A0ABQ5UX59_9PROT|nr:glutathione S-transferase family protein [Algimonas porphyrae]GLQ19437.1 glutathione S-transferase [Algimonas porphyrae]
MITLHHLENSQSIRILWLLEELGGAYGFKMYDRDPETMLAPDDYKALSPLGTAPVITDGTVVLAESNAIIDYILDKAPNQDLRPKTDDADRVPYLFWFHAAQGSYQSLQTGRFVNSIAVERSPRLVRGIIRKVMATLDSAFYGPRLSTVMGMMEEQLSQHPFIAGERFTAADIALGYTVQMASMRGQLSDDYPHTQAYVERMEARPAWQAALAKDGKFQGVPS